jgi:preprotein translocase subunit YajC
MFWMIAEAATTSPSDGKTQAPWWASNPMIPMILIIAVMYFFLFRSKKTQQKKLDDLLNNVKKGDRVQTIGGIRGAVVEAREDEVVIKVDESSNAKITFARSAIHKVLEEEKK